MAFYSNACWEEVQVCVMLLEPLAGNVLKRCERNSDTESCSLTLLD